MENSTSVGLLSLPAELLICLPDFLHDLEDFKNLSSTCRLFRTTLSSTSSRTIFRLAVAASRIFFRPSPDFLVAATARQLGTWAAASPENEAILFTEVRGGIDSVLELCLQHTDGLTMQRIRELHLLRFSTINPALDLVDKCIGEQWYATPDFWNGGVEDAYTLDVDPPDAFFQLVTYGEIFAADLDIYLGCESKRRMLSIDTRLEFVKYCIPDWACYVCQTSARLDTDENNVIPPRRAVQEIGPYKDFSKSKSRFRGNQVALIHLWRSPIFNRYLNPIRQNIGPDFEQDWKQELWKTVFLCQGLESMELLFPGTREDLKARLRERWERINALTEKPKPVKVGTATSYDFPFFEGDLKICTTGFLGGT